ncbi:hypothetical protein VNO77_38887 [Canavalia gladiata]|uniref:Uncharacterized protein n=1 Tax=Canavalia gladiata TaxID=3824 RepID=A0AAN9KB80_CANGL
MIGVGLAILLVFALSPKPDPFSNGWIKNHSYLCDDHDNNNVTDWPSFAGSIPVIIYHNTRSMRSQCVNNQHVNPLHCSYNLPFLIPMYENHYTLGLIKNRVDRGTLSTSIFPKTRLHQRTQAAPSQLPQAAQTSPLDFNDTPSKSVFQASCHEYEVQSIICRGRVWVYMLVQPSCVYEFYLKCTVLAATIGRLAIASHVPDGHVLMAITSEVWTCAPTCMQAGARPMMLIPLPSMQWSPLQEPKPKGPCFHLPKIVERKPFLS